MYKMNLNNYHPQPKNSTIYTPPEVSEFIYELLKDKIPKSRASFSPAILDPCCGQSSLLKPWEKAKYYRTFGIDVDPNCWPGRALNKDFLQLKTVRGLEIKQPHLILCNPPFNGYGNKLGSEVWLNKIIELFGQDVPLVLFAPMGFRLNSKKRGKRWTKFINQVYPPISSIISLPRDIFAGVEFHSEILIFNVKGLEPHYFFSLAKGETYE